MFDSPFLSIVIALVFIFLITAVMVTAVNDLIFTFARSRAKNLEKFLSNLFFNDKQWDKIFNSIKNSPFINVLKKKPNSFPGAIPAENFATAILAHIGKNNLTIEAIKKAVEENKDSDSEFYTMLKALLSQNPSYEQLGKEIEKIFNNAMDRLTGWYKRNAKILSFIVALVICASLNIDTLTITKNLWNDKDKAEQIASFAATASKYMEKNDSAGVVFQNGIDTLAFIKAENRTLTESKAGKLISGIDTTGAKTSEKQMVRSYNILAKLDIPIGWSKDNIPRKTDNGWKNFGLWLLKVLGILVTSAAVSLGAPFWFDILNKVTPLKQGSAKRGSSSAANQGLSDGGGQPAKQ
jgi:hypothetical protein